MKNFDIVDYQNKILFTDFHTHSNYTDGNNAVSENISHAINNKLKAVAITEHIRKKPSYNPVDLYSEIEIEREKNKNIDILFGFEAKIVNLKGDLDVSKKLINSNMVNFISGAFHSWPLRTLPKKQDYIKILENSFRQQLMNIWAHPFLGARNYKIKLSKKDIVVIAKLLKENNITFEINLRYALPSSQEIEIFIDNGIDFVIGSDAHYAKDIWNKNIPYFIPTNLWQKIKNYAKKK